MRSPTFAGSGKPEGNLLETLELRYIYPMYRFIPKYIQTYHLTLLTFLWSGLLLLFGFLARQNLSWLWLTNLMIIMQYLTDYFDGIVGRSRHTGLITWGFYMDHLLDFVFMCSIFIGYFLFLPAWTFPYLAFLLITTATFMANTFLLFVVKRVFHHHYFQIGPSEVRFLVVLLNIVLVIVGKEKAVVVLPAIAFVYPLPLIISVYSRQKDLWLSDMKTKKRST